MDIYPETREILERVVRLESLRIGYKLTEAAVVHRALEEYAEKIGIQDEDE